MMKKYYHIAMENTVMKRCKRPLALLTSCMLLTNGICTDMLFSRHQPAETKTLREFAAQLTEESDAAPHRELFRTLRFSGREQQLYRDGEPVGQSYAGCRIENGRLVILNGRAECAYTTGGCGADRLLRAGAGR
ncbi:MAG: hypothetical protein IJL32_09715 [Oscillospiraceae bacterium]|nr:hypothetical protein [Oscillospiraceae bacterium]